MYSKIIKEYKKQLTESYSNRHDSKAIFPSELCWFFNYAREYESKIDFVLESGAYQGLTAKKLSLLFPKTKVMTFEMRKNRYKRFRDMFSGFEFVYGMLDVKLIKPGKTFVLIDGPKREGAIKLAKKCLKAGALFVGIHDMAEYLDLCKKTFKTVIHSGNMPEEFRALDSSVEKQIDGVWGNFYGNVLAIVK